jgi:hypothetical protein
MISVSQSKSKTTIRPPGRVTRTISESARARIREVLEQARCSTDVECAVGKRKCSRFADLERDRQRALFGAPSGLGDHDFACIQSNEPAIRADALDHVEQDVPWAAAGIQDRVAGRQCGALHYQSLARLDRFRLLRLIHEPHKEIRILCAVNLREEIGMRTHPFGHRATTSILCTAAYEDRLVGRLLSCVIADAIAIDEEEQRELRREGLLHRPRSHEAAAAAPVGHSLGAAVDERLGLPPTWPPFRPSRCPIDRPVALDVANPEAGLLARRLPPGGFVPIRTAPRENRTAPSGLVCTSSSVVARPELAQLVAERRRAVALSAGLCRRVQQRAVA